MDIRFKAISFKERSVGKIIKSSKIEYIWQFEIKTKICFLVLQASKFSGNFSILLNKEILFKGNLFLNPDFLFNFKIEGIVLTLTRIHRKYKLLIENILFMDFYDIKKTRKTFFLTPKVSDNINCSKNSKLKKSLSAKLIKKRNNNKHSSLLRVKKENLEEYNSVKTIKKNILDNIQNQNMDKNVNKVQLYSKNKENNKRLRFTKDFKEFEEMEIFLYPVDFPRQTPKIKKIVEAIHRDHFD